MTQMYMYSRCESDAQEHHIRSDVLIQRQMGPCASPLCRVDGQEAEGTDEFWETERPLPTLCSIFRPYLRVLCDLKGAAA